MSGKALCVVILAAVCAGCVTDRDRVAVVRGSKFATETGTPVGEAVGRELAEVAVDIGADKIDPATVPVTAEAADENAAGIKAARESRLAVWAAVKAGAKWVADATGWGWLATALTAAAGAATWLRKRKAQLQSAKAEEILGVAARGIKAIQDGETLPEILASEAKGLVSVNLAEVNKALEDGRNGEI